MGYHNEVINWQGMMANLREKENRGIISLFKGKIW